MKNNKRIKFLDIVVPFCMAYIFMFILYSILWNQNDINFFIVLLISTCSFFVMYGMFAFLRDFVHVLTDFNKKVIEIILKILKYD